MTLNRIRHPTESRQTMQKHTVQIGTQHFDNSTGAPTGNDHRDVQFRAEEAASVDRKKDTCGTKKRLFKLHQDDVPATADADERYLVHLYHWDNWQGNPHHRQLEGPFEAEEISEEHPQLAKKGGVAVPLGLEDAV